MKIIPKNEFKRGDALLHTEEHVIRYLYFDKIEKVAKTEEMVVFSRPNINIKEAFHSRFKYYEVINVFDQDGKK